MALTGVGHALNQTVIPMVIPLIDKNCEFREKLSNSTEFRDSNKITVFYSKKPIFDRKSSYLNRFLSKLTLFQSIPGPFPKSPFLKNGPI